MRKCFFVLGMAIGLCSSAQPSLAKLAENGKNQKQESFYTVKLANATQGAVQFSASSRLLNTGIKDWLSSSLGLRISVDELQKTGPVTSYSKDIAIEKYQQWYNGIKVEHGYANVMSQAGRVKAVQLEFYPLEDGFVTRPVLTGEEALQKAVAFVGASKYAWEDYTGSDPAYQKPSGELVIVEDYYGKKGRMNLAYKFQISAEEPFSRSWVYVSATDGKLLLVDRVVKHFSPDINGSAFQKQNIIAEPKTEKEASQC